MSPTAATLPQPKIRISLFELYKQHSAKPSDSNANGHSNTTLSTQVAKKFEQTPLDKSLFVRIGRYQVIPSLTPHINSEVRLKIFASIREQVQKVLEKEIGRNDIEGNEINSVLKKHPNFKALFDPIAIRKWCEIVDDIPKSYYGGPNYTNSNISESQSIIISESSFKTLTLPPGGLCGLTSCYPKFEFDDDQRDYMYAVWDGFQALITTSAKDEALKRQLGAGSDPNNKTIMENSRSAGLGGMTMLQAIKESQGLEIEDLTDDREEEPVVEMTGTNKEIDSPTKSAPSSMPKTKFKSYTRMGAGQINRNSALSNGTIDDIVIGCIPCDVSSDEDEDNKDSKEQEKIKEREILINEMERKLWYSEEMKEVPKSKKEGMWSSIEGYLKKRQEFIEKFDKIVVGSDSESKESEDSVNAGTNKSETVTVKPSNNNSKPDDSVSDVTTNDSDRDVSDKENVDVNSNTDTDSTKASSIDGIPITTSRKINSERNASKSTVDSDSNSNSNSDSITEAQSASESATVTDSTTSEPINPQVFRDLVRYSDHIHILLPDLARRVFEELKVLYASPINNIDFSKIDMIPRVAPHISAQYRTEQKDLYLLENMRRYKYERQELWDQLVEEQIKESNGEEMTDSGLVIAKCPAGCKCGR